MIYRFALAVCPERETMKQGKPHQRSASQWSNHYPIILQTWDVKNPPEPFSATRSLKIYNRGGENQHEIKQRSRPAGGAPGSADVALVSHEEPMRI